MEDIATELTCIFPGAFMLDTLSRLPVKSLLKFSCVRKSWYNLVKDPRFIELHSDHSSKAENDTFVEVRSKKSFFRKTVRSETSVIRLGSSKVEKTGLVEQGKVGIIGSSNGLVCLTYLDKRFGVEFKVVNPALGQHQCVLKLPTAGNYASSNGSDYMSFGFGFDKTNGDYKILRIERLTKTSQGKTDWYAKIYIYSFRSHSWRTIQPPENVLFQFKSHLSLVTIGSRLYQLSSDRKNTAIILVFDLSSEKFHTVPFPPPRNGYENIVAWKNESLAMVLPNHDNIFPGGYELWVLNKDNSWRMTMKFSLDGLPDTLFATRPESDDDFPIFCGHEKGYSLVYLKKKKSDVFGIHEIARFVKSTRICSYRETLVPLCKPQSLKALKTKASGSFKDGSKVYEKVPYVMRLL